MEWSCLAAGFACLALVFAAYFLVRHHGRVDGNTLHADFEQGSASWHKGQHGLAVLFFGVGMFKLVRPGLVGTVATVSAALIAGICGGLTFEQGKWFACLLAETVSDKDLSICPRSP